MVSRILNRKWQPLTGCAHKGFCLEGGSCCFGYNSAAVFGSDWVRSFCSCPFRSCFDSCLVLLELQHAKTPAAVREWAEHLPEWIEVRQASGPFNEQLIELEIGEREAIQLAMQLGIGLLLMDEREGTLVAKKQGLEVVGTIGITLELAQLNLVSLEEALERVGRTNFRRTADLFDRVRALARHRGMHLYQ